MRNRLLAIGEPAPWFICRTTKNERFHFDTVAGRYVVLCFFVSAAEPRARLVLSDLARRRELFDDERIAFFGVSNDVRDEQLERVSDSLPGIHIFWDFDLAVCREYGVVRSDDPSLVSPRLVTYVLDPHLRVVAVIPFDEEPTAQHAERLFLILDQLPALAEAQPADPQAPVLIVPRVFEPELCEELIAAFDRQGGSESGFMRDVDGKTVGIIDRSFKRRRDCEITDESLRRKCSARIHDRLAPEILKAYQFRATRMERYVVARYDSQGGFFRPHRDNTTKGTAHRKFAVSLHLNTGHYGGGFVRFPEFGPQLYSAPAGGAVVFSCSLLHEATPVTRGARYVFLPFLYDEDAARLRQSNLRFLTSATRPVEPASVLETPDY